jgi:uncharacterized ferredoxin-like protein
MDPEVWIVEPQRMQSQLNGMGASVSDSMLMANILGELLNEYDHVADNLASQENKTIASVSLILKDNYERLKKSANIKSSEETVLVGYKKFSGDCRYCGKKGHTSADCFKKRDDRNKTEVVKNKCILPSTLLGCAYSCV